MVPEEVSATVNIPPRTRAPLTLCRVRKNLRLHGDNFSEAAATYGNSALP